jgi:hypothetical protein
MVAVCVSSVDVDPQQFQLADLGDAERRHGGQVDREQQRAPSPRRSRPARRQSLPPGGGQVVEEMHGLGGAGRAHGKLAACTTCSSRCSTSEATAAPARRPHRRSACSPGHRGRWRLALPRRNPSPRPIVELVTLRPRIGLPPVPLSQAAGPRCASGDAEGRSASGVLHQPIALTSGTLARVPLPRLLPSQRCPVVDERVAVGTA